jgi:hypothetical protein
MICDFCSSCVPAWRYPAESFRDQFNSVSQGDWLACRKCHDLIEAGDRSGLAERVLLTEAVRMGVVSKKLARQYARDLHNRFFRARRGEAHRIEWAAYL